MRITLRLYGNLRKYARERRETDELEFPRGTTIKLLLESCGVPENSWWMAAINDQVVEADAVLQDGDLVEVFDPVGGGSGCCRLLGCPDVELTFLFLSSRFC